MLKENLIKEIHDQFLPTLLSIIYQIEYWQKVMESDSVVSQRLIQIKENLELAVKEARKLLISLKPPRLVEKSLPKALDYYLKRLKETRGLKYHWVTPPPSKQVYKYQDDLLLVFLELLANLPEATEVFFAFRPLHTKIELGISFKSLNRNWPSEELKKLLRSRLTAKKGRLTYKNDNGRKWLMIELPEK